MPCAGPSCRMVSTLLTGHPTKSHPQVLCWPCTCPPATTQLPPDSEAGSNGAPAQWQLSTFAELPLDSVTVRPSKLVPAESLIACLNLVCVRPSVVGSGPTTADVSVVGTGQQACEPTFFVATTRPTTTNKSNAIRIARTEVIGPPEREYEE